MREIAASLMRILWMTLRYHSIKVFVVCGLGFVIGMCISGILSGRVR